MFHHIETLNPETHDTKGIIIIIIIMKPYEHTC